MIFWLLSVVLLYWCNEENISNYENNLAVDNEITINYNGTQDLENKDEIMQNDTIDEKIDTIQVKIWENILTVKLENNSSTEAFVEKLKDWEIVIKASEYWNFEKIWDLGFSLPRNDENIKTQVWDIVLYQWNQISLFYNSNSWSYTKLWQIEDISTEKLKEILWEWDVELTFSLIK